MTITKFEDLEIWKAAREICKKIRSIAENTKLEKDFSLKDQVIRSSGSIMDNVAEGFERDGKKEFVQFLSIAKASCGETRSQVHRIFDAGYISEEKHQELFEDCTSLSAQIAGFIKYLNRSEYQGIKRK
ncbi:MAG: four helix bundle protein [Bacteroidales bacterium]|nr:four helix bundle protein [Bacteroidales bacterium]MDZ4205250.1 four helix bundle protein [Bacteroidales bacterium]